MKNSVLFICNLSRPSHRHVVRVLDRLGIAASGGIDSLPVVIPEWKLETKYYSASLQLRFLSEAEAHHLSRDDLASQVDALIFLNDKSMRVELFEEWMEWAESSGPNVVAFCAFDSSDAPVSTSSSSLMRPDSVQEYLLQWPFVEYIDMSLTSTKDNSDDTLEFVSPIEEKFGLDRLVELLETNVWEGHLPSLKASSVSAHVGETNSEDVAVEKTFQSVASVLNQLLTGVDDDDQGVSADAILDMDSLVSQFRDLRQKCLAMPDDKRREMGAKIAMTYATSIFADDDSGDELVESAIREP